MNPYFALLLFMGSLILAISVVGMKGSFEHIEISGNGKGILADRTLDNMPTTGVNPEHGFKKTPLYRIKDSPGKNWKEMGYVFNSQFGFDHSSGKAVIFVGTILKERFIKNVRDVYGTFLSDPQAVELSFFYQWWRREKAERAGWKDVISVNEGKTKVNGSETYWNIFEYAEFFNEFNELINERRMKNKIYFIEGNEYCFRIWLKCAIESFDDFINDFDRYIKTFEIIS